MGTRMLVPLVLLFLNGCGAASNNGTNDAVPGRPIETNIPQGIYVGEITRHTQTWLNGVLVDDVTTTEPYNEIVDENGLPLIQPEGVSPVEGLVLDSASGAFVSQMTIESVNAFGNRLVIGWTGQLEIEELVLGVTGTWTYEFISPNTLEFLEQSSAISNVSDFGDLAFISITATASLTR